MTNRACKNCKFAAVLLNNEPCSTCVEDSSKPSWTSRETDTLTGIHLTGIKAVRAVAASDRQEGGSHYTKLAIQPFQYSMANGLDPYQHTVIKYVTRHADKAGIVDLRKAIHTLELYIEWLEGQA